MHPDPAFRWDDASALAFVADVSFAHLFAMTPLGPRVVHVPLIVAGDRLRFHLSNRNAVTPHLAGRTALASVGGAQGYISPTWYADGRGQVPTWNYTAVEVEGPVRALTGDELVDLLDVSSATHEDRVGRDWTRAKMTPERFAAMCAAITGFELTAHTVRATRKLSQNKSAADRAGVAAARPELVG